MRAAKLMSNRRRDDDIFRRSPKRLGGIEGKYESAARLDRIAFAATALRECASDDEPRSDYLR